jgi:hypothetical protein
VKGELSPSSKCLIFPGKGDILSANPRFYA